MSKMRLCLDVSRGFVEVRTYNDDDGNDFRLHATTVRLDDIAGVTLSTDAACVQLLMKDTPGHQWDFDVRNPRSWEETENPSFWLYNKLQKAWKYPHDFHETNNQLSFECTWPD